MRDAVCDDEGPRHRGRRVQHSVRGYQRVAERVNQGIQTRELRAKAGSLGVRRTLGYICIWSGDTATEDLPGFHARARSSARCHRIEALASMASVDISPSALGTLFTNFSTVWRYRIVRESRP